MILAGARRLTRLRTYSARKAFRYSPAVLTLPLDEDDPYDRLLSQPASLLLLV